MSSIDQSELVARIGALRSSHGGISTLASAAGWKKTAVAVSVEGERLLAQIASTLLGADQRYRAATVEGDKRPFWRRLFKTPEMRSVYGEIKRLNAAVKQVTKQMGLLQQVINYWPTNEEERQLKITELKLEKKALAADKRELGAAMRDVKVSARQASANAASGFIETSTERKAVADRKRDIASGREAKLAPLEQRRQRIEQAILSLDRAIIRIESM